MSSPSGSAASFSAPDSGQPGAPTEEPQAAGRRPSDLLRLAGAGALGGVILWSADAVRVHLTHGRNLEIGVDRLVFLLGTLGALTLCGTALIALARGWDSAAVWITRRFPAGRTRLRGALRAALSAAPAAFAVGALNGVFWGKQPAVWAGGVAVTWSVTAWVIALRYPLSGEPARWGRGLVAAGAAIGCGAAVHADATYLVNLYPDQHLTLWLAGLAFAVALAAELMAALPVRGRAFAALLALGALLGGGSALFSLGGADVSQNARYLAYEAAPSAGHALRLLARATDWDGDGAFSLFGAGDCDNGAADVHPAAREIADNGRDDDCLGGDLDEGARALLASRMSAPTSAVANPPAPRHVVWVSVDALRADRVWPRPETAGPAARRFAAATARGAAFRRMYVPYPSTILSLWSILTSRYPSQAQLTAYHQFQVPSDDPSPSVASVLRANGYRAGAFLFHHIFEPKLGIARGFDHVWFAGSAPEVVNETRASVETVDRALAWAERNRDGRVFLWVHLYDPHEPYLSHPEFPSEDTEEARYDAEVAYADRELGRLLDGLERLGVLPDAQLWLFADHGEEFGDHGGQFHASSLYEEQVAVPAALVMPGVAPTAVAAPASLIDLAPTVLDLQGLAAETPDSFRGRSLAPLLAQPDGPARPVLLECFRKDGAVLRGLVDGPWKLVHWRDERFFELYNLERDPSESMNVFDLLPRQAAAFERLLGAWVASELQ